jgi:hypothetical protein
MGLHGLLQGELYLFLTYTMHRLIRLYKYYVLYIIHRLVLMKTVLFIIKTQRFGDWILSPSSGKTKLLDLIYITSMDLVYIPILKMWSGDRD